MVSIKEAIIINEEKEEVVVVIDEMEETICEHDDSISLLTQKDPISSSDSESEEEEDIPTTVEQATPRERVGVESKEEDIPTTVEQATPGERVGIESPASPEPRPSPASTSSASKRRRLEEEDNYRVITWTKLNDELFTLEKRLARTRAAYESARKSKLRHLLMDSYLQDLVPKMSKYLLVLSLTNNLLVSFSFHRGRT